MIGVALAVGSAESARVLRAIYRFGAPRGITAAYGDFSICNPRGSLRFADWGGRSPAEVGGYDNWQGLRLPLSVQPTRASR